MSASATLWRTLRHVLLAALVLLWIGLSAPVVASPGVPTTQAVDHSVHAGMNHLADAIALPPGHDHPAADANDSFFSNFLKVYTPRRVCMFLEGPLIWLHIVSDLLIAAAYYSIPVALVTFVRRRTDVVFGWVFWLFALFILLCGTTHVMGVLSIWTPYYRLDGVIKGLTAVVSVATAIMLWPQIPKALAIPSRTVLEREVAERTQELRTSHDALQRSEERYRLVNKATNDVIWDWDIAAQTILWSESLQRTFGHDPVKAGPPLEWWKQQIHPDDRDRVIGSIEAALHERRDSWSQEYRFRRADETYASVVDRAHVSRDEAGQPRRMVGAMLDQTERHEAAAERERLLEGERKARAEAEEANRLKDEFLATLSHELRTPLNAILGWSQLLEGTRWSNASVSEGLAVIHRNARSQLQLIEDLLDMSRITSGKLQIELSVLNLADLVKSAAETIRPTAVAKGIRLDVQSDESHVQIRGDSARLQQVLWNLLSNAVKFTPAGGRVTLSTRTEQDRVEVSVTDSGIGIDPSFLPHVFERFRQADGSTTRRYGGLGLGLSIVKTIVEAHGGTIQAESAGAGQGARFTVALPAMIPDDLPAGRVSPEPQQQVGVDSSFEDALKAEGSLRGLNVLVVDDEQDVRDLMRRTLEQFEARTVEASSADQALERYRAKRPDVMLIDIGMPGTDGYELIRQLRQLDATNGGPVPAAALTAFARAEDRRRALLAGFNLHIAKPVTPTDLVASVASLARRVQRH